VDRTELALRAEGDERIPVSLSSDAPVERWFGAEVLDHTKSAIDMSRAANGLPLLYNHDTDQPIGRLEEVALRKDGRLGGMIRFSRNTRAQEVRMDVEDGILTDMSVGYRINEWVEERAAGSDKATYRATNWTPMEGSIVPVPADHTVGINRGADLSAPKAPVTPEEQHMAEEVTPTPAPAPVAVSGERGMPRELETKLIAQVADTFEMQRELPRWIGAGMSLEDVRKDVEKVATRKAQEATPAGHVELSEKEQQSYSMSRAILSLADTTGRSRNGLEWEISDEIAKRTGRTPQGLYMPLSMQHRASVTGNIVGTSSLGGAAVQTSLLSLIEILRNRLIASQAGVTVLSGLTDSISFPRQITANTFTWTGENPTAANSLTALTLDNVTMSPKTGMASTAFSRRALAQTSPDVQNMVTNDLMRICAIGVDSAVFNGLGSANQPTGIRATSSIGNRTLGSAGAALSWADLVGLETDVAVANADGGTLAYVTNAKVRGKLKQTLKTTTAGSSFLWEGGNDPGTINGYRAFASQQIPSNLTQGTSGTICSSIIFGDFAQAILGLWGDAVDLIVDPYSSKNQNMIEVTAVLMCDVAVRHPEAFSKSDAVLTT
jgi:HK97 family phage major capsid protein/HK97 family phage prohead protease